VASQNIELVSLEAGPSSSLTGFTQTTRTFTDRVTPNTSSTAHRRTTTGINSGFVSHDDTASIHSGSHDHEGAGLLQLHSEGVNQVQQPQHLNEKSSADLRPHILWAEALDKRHRGLDTSPTRYNPANMKFSHSLQFNSVPDWSAYYIAYDNLKKLYV
jgi:phosphate transporter